MSELNSEDKKLHEAITKAMENEDFYDTILEAAQAKRIASLAAENKKLKCFTGAMLSNVSLQEFDRIVNSTIDFEKLKTELAAGKRLWMDAQKRCKAQALRGDKLQAELEKYIAVAQFAFSFVDLKPEHRLYESIRQDLKASLKLILPED